MARDRKKPDKKGAKPKGTKNKPERIAKVLARAGVASRREVERMIADGRVAIKGEILDTPATLVVGTRNISVDGNPVAEAEGTRVWRYHKPRGMMTTHNDPEGRPTVFDALPKSLGRVISVGRLDYNTEGLLLLSNDGGLARWMELPKTGWKRQYRVRVHGTVDEEALKKLRKGISVDGINYGEINAMLERTTGTNAWLKIAIREGKNREVRKVLEHLGLQVTRLIRTAYGPFELGALEHGKVDEISAEGLRESVPHNLITEGPKRASTDEKGEKPPRTSSKSEGGKGGKRGEPRKDQRREGKKIQGQGQGRSQDRNQGRSRGRGRGR
jgi:23S rRNA pseudouridine2605 synthase